MTLKLNILATDQLFEVIKVRRTLLSQCALTSDSPCCLHNEVPYTKLTSGQ